VEITPKRKRDLFSNCTDILRIGNILGILSETPSVYFEKKKHSEAHKKFISPEIIEALIKDRETARKTKDFKRADEIREKLKGLNVQIEDRPDGTIWKFIQ
jgi:cysteinyl-tRNA synthetase